MSNEFQHEEGKQEYLYYQVKDQKRRYLCSTLGTKAFIGVLGQEPAKIPEALSHDLG
jgi:hypothetical protein